MEKQQKLWTRKPGFPDLGPCPASYLRIWLGQVISLVWVLDLSFTRGSSSLRFSLLASIDYWEILCQLLASVQALEVFMFLIKTTTTTLVHYKLLGDSCVMLQKRMKEQGKVLTKTCHWAPLESSHAQGSSLSLALAFLWVLWGQCRLVMLTSSFYHKGHTQKKRFTPLTMELVLSRHSLGQGLAWLGWQLSFIYQLPQGSITDVVCHWQGKQCSQYL